MQRFTAFSILLSLIVVLATVDVLFSGYLGGGESAPENIETDPSIETDVSTETVDNSIDNSVDTTTTDGVSTPLETSLEPLVELQEEKVSSWLTKDLLTQSGFFQPVVKEALFSGLIFQIIPFNDGANTQTLQLNFFDGEVYVGTFYEVVYATDTGSFQGYLSLREAAKNLTDLGTVNEVNMYGNASFYFNHKTKVKTIHMLALYGNRVLGFEYAQTEHEKMKKLFDNLVSLQ
jgi:hypothetical protein